MSQRLEELTQTPEDAISNFKEIRDEISKEFGQAKSEEYRVALLGMFKSILDMVEATVAPENREKFKKIRLADYRSFIIQESLVGENVCTETLDAVTRREIEAGRMDPDDDLRKTAEMGMAVPFPSRAELLEIDAKKRAADALAASPPVSGWRRALAWMRRS